MVTSPGPSHRLYQSTLPSVCAILPAGMNVKVIIERGEDGYFVAHVPALKSCWSQGKTRDEAIANIREAIDLYLEVESVESDGTKDQEIVELIV